MKERPLNIEEVLGSLPPTPASYLEKIKKWHSANKGKIIVIDDDPTGCQTVHDIPILTEWTVDTIKKEWENSSPLFFILTNSRSMPEEEVRVLFKEISENILEAADNRIFTIISRSDSTLRGHYPVETNVLKSCLGKDEAIDVLIPAFFEGGRYTLDGTHYVKENKDLVPAHLTPFAKDVSFGFKKSYLPDWVEEKTEGEIRSEDVTVLDIQKIRKTSLAELQYFLDNLKSKSVCAIDAFAHTDLEKVSLALCQSSNKFLFRTAASFVQCFGGIPHKELLDAKTLKLDTSEPGLILVGSYVPKTTTQLNYLLEQNLPLTSIEIKAQSLLKSPADAIEKYLSNISEQVKSGKHILLYTSRQFVAGNTPEEQLKDSKVIADGLVKIVRQLPFKPSFIVTKGGITSHDTATKGLDIKRTIVKGQIIPGVPVWETGTDCKYGKIPFIVFPGNVGNENSLYQVCQQLISRK